MSFIYPPGDFSFIAERGERSMLADAYQAVTKANAWQFFKEIQPPDGQGYMFWDATELRLVQSHMKQLDYHSGASYGMTMRTMQYIAIHGWDAFVLKRQTPPKIAELQD